MLTLQNVCYKCVCGKGFVYSIMKLPEIVRAWLTSQQKLFENEKQVTFLTKQLQRLEEELKEVRRENTDLRMPLLCESCKRYLQSKHPGDTIEICPCVHCIGIA